MRVGVVDLFCGCGGMSTGFASCSVPGAHVEVVAGLDIDPSACATYERMLQRPAHCMDAQELLDDPGKFQNLLQTWNLKSYDRSILIGCAPCQGFAAHRKAASGDDPRRHLFTLFTQIAVQLDPYAIIIENVPDLFSKRHWHHYSEGVRALEDVGFVVHSRVYNFAGFGLPQERFRAVIIAMKQEFDMPAPPLSPENFKTVRDVIQHLPPLEAGEICPTDPMHKTSNHRDSTISILKQVPIDGGNRPIGVGPECLDRARQKYGGYTDVYGRLAWDRPSATVTARCRTPSCGRFAHPEQHRGLSIREAALLQGFPAEYFFEGGFDEKFKQIGNAVPPLVAEQLADHTIRQLIGARPLLPISLESDVLEPVGPGFAVKINGIKRRRRREPAAVGGNA